MRITYLGHDGLRLQPTDGGAILVDPWLNPAGAFAGGWWPFPRVCATDVDAWLADVCGVVITQPRPDRLDPWVLRRLPADMPIAVPAYTGHGFSRALRRAGVSQPVVELRPWRWWNPTGDVRLAFVPEVSSRLAATVVAQEGKAAGDCRTLCHVGDARLAPMQARGLAMWLGVAPDALTLRAAVADFHPQRTVTDSQAREARARHLRRERLEAAWHVIRILKPAAVLAAGGTVCVPDETRLAVNDQWDGGPFVDAEEIAEMLRRRQAPQARAWRRGDVVDLNDPQAHAGDGPRPVESPATELAALADEVRERMTDQERLAAPALSDESWPAERRAVVRDWFAQLLAGAPELARSINLRLMVVATGSENDSLAAWRVDFTASPQVVEGAAAEEPPDERAGPVGETTLHVPGRWLHAACAGATDWESVLYGLRFRFESDASRTRAEQLLQLLLIAGDEPAEAGANARARMDAARWVPVPGPHGRVTSVWRHCPHAQVDLLTAGELLPDGGLRCLAHGYDFDLATGRCRNAPECSGLTIGDENE